MKKGMEGEWNWKWKIFGLFLRIFYILNEGAYLVFVSKKKFPTQILCINFIHYPNKMLLPFGG